MMMMLLLFDQLAVLVLNNLLCQVMVFYWVAFLLVFQYDDHHIQHDLVPIQYCYYYCDDYEDANDVEFHPLLMEPLLSC